MGLFGNNSVRTNSQQKEDVLRPITLRFGADSSLKRVKDIIPELQPEEFIKKEDYHELYIVKDNIEFTLTFIEDLGKTHLTILAYSEKRTFKLKKNLKMLMSFLREKLKDYIE